MTAERLTGAWELVGYEVPQAPPERRYPLGARPLEIGRAHV